MLDYRRLLTYIYIYKYKSSLFYLFACLFVQVSVEITTVSIPYKVLNIRIYKVVSKVGDCSQGQPESSLFDSYYTEVLGEGATSFPGLLHFTLDTHLIMLSVKQGGIKYYFVKVFRKTRLGIKPRSLRPLANTQYPQGQ